MAKAATVFTWQGKDRHGQARKGEISATSLSEAKNLLRRQGISANKVKKLAKPLFGGGQKITPADISVISRQIATMLAAGVTLIQSLEMIAQGHSKQSMRKLLAEITDEVKSGNPLSSALRKHSLYFDDLYCDLVYTGEQSGALETIYDRIATYKEKAEALKSKKQCFTPLRFWLLLLLLRLSSLFSLCLSSRRFLVALGLNSPPSPSSYWLFPVSCKTTVFLSL